MTRPTTQKAGNSCSCLIAPSVLTADFTNLGEQIRALEQGGADWLHLDVMDGHFVPEISFGASLVSAMDRITNLFLDVHLMVMRPEDAINKMLEAGADQITFHIEATQHPHKLLEQIRRAGKLAGIALNPGTPPQAVQELTELADTLVVMTVNPGYGGQQLIPTQLNKIARLRALLEKTKNRRTRIMADGGVNQKTVSDCVRAGADTLVVGSAILGTTDYKKAIGEIRALTQSIQ